MIDYTCPKCGEAMSSPNSQAGQPEKCPACGNVAVIPAKRVSQFHRKAICIAVGVVTLLGILFAGIVLYRNANADTDGSNAPRNKPFHKHSHASARSPVAPWNKPFVANARRRLYYRSEDWHKREIDDENILGYDTAADAEADGFRPCPKLFKNKGYSYPYYPYPYAEAEKAKLMADLPVGIDEAWVENLVAELSREYDENPGRLWCVIDALLDASEYSNKIALELELRKIIEMSPRRHGM